MLSGDTLLSSEPLISVAFSFRRCYKLGRLVPLKKSLGKCLSIWTKWCCMGWVTSEWLLSPAGPQCWDAESSRFESYIRSQCHFLASLILSPGNPNNVAEVAAPVLEGFVSVSPGTNLGLICFAIFVPTKILTKTFCPHRAKEFSAFRCIWR